MVIDTNVMIPFAEAQQSFSKVARLVDENGMAVILKNDVPRYLVVDFQQADEERGISDEDLMDIARRVMEKNLPAYKELAK